MIALRKKESMRRTFVGIVFVYAIAYGCDSVATDYHCARYVAGDG